MNEHSTTNSPVSQPISSEDISRRAYELWENEGRPDNCDLRHWLQAEAELGIGRSDAPENGVSESSPAAAPHTGSDVRPLEGTRAAAAANRDNRRGTKNEFTGEKTATGNGAAQTAARRKPSNSPPM
jgi:hypothetical protein